MSSVHRALLTLALAGCGHAVPLIALPPAPLCDTRSGFDDVDRCPDDPGLCGPPAADDDGCPPIGPPRLHVDAAGVMSERARADLIAFARDAIAAPIPDGVDVVVIAHALPNEPPGPARARATAIALTL